MSEKAVFTCETSKFICQMEPIVVYDDYVDIPGAGKVKATFDFSEMPEEHHQIAIQAIMRGAMRIHMPRNLHSVPTQQKHPEPERKGLLGKFFDLFR